MANPRTYVEAPPVTPLPYGLLSAAVVLDDLEGTRALGVHYEPGYCGPVYDSTGACQDPVDFGTLSVSVDNTSLATITADGNPLPATYTIDWGDDSTSSSSDPDGDTHDYAAPGSYIVLITDDTHGYRALVTVTVTDAQATGPFDAATRSSSTTCSAAPRSASPPTSSGPAPRLPCGWVRAARWSGSSARSCRSATTTGRSAPARWT